MWLQEGKASYQSWEGGIVSGSIRGNANLKSSIQIIDSDGKKYPMLKEGTEYVMGGNPGENINIKLQTSSDGDPRSDKYGVYIKKLDLNYLAKVQEDYLKTLGASRKKYLLEHPDELSAAVNDKVNPKFIDWKAGSPPEVSNVSSSKPDATSDHPDLPSP